MAREVRRERKHPPRSESANSESGIIKHEAVACNLRPQFGIPPARTESEAQPILICQKMLCLAGGSVVLLPSVFFALPLLLLSRVLLHSSWRTNETSVTWQAAYTWAASLEDATLWGTDLTGWERTLQTVPQTHTTAAAPQSPECFLTCCVFSDILLGNNLWIFILPWCANCPLRNIPTDASCGGVLGWQQRRAPGEPFPQGPDPVHLVRAKGRENRKVIYCPV